MHLRRQGVPGIIVMRRKLAQGESTIRIMPEQFVRAGQFDVVPPDVKAAAEVLLKI